MKMLSARWKRQRRRWENRKALKARSAGILPAVARASRPRSTRTRTDFMAIHVADLATRLLSLEGKVAMITGAASGIGHGISVRLAEMGASVSVLDIDANKGEEAAAEIRSQGGEVLFTKCDVRTTTDCRRAIDAAISKWGRIDILCNCAGIAI